MQQTALFHDDIYEAISTDVQALGGPKKVAVRLWPHKKDPGAAGEYLKCCLRADRAEKLDPEQVMLIKNWAKEVGSYATLTFESQDIGFEFQIIEPEDEIVRLQRQFIAAQEGMGQILKRMEKLNLPTAVRGVA